MEIFVDGLQFGQQTVEVCKYVSRAFLLFRVHDAISLVALIHPMSFVFPKIWQIAKSLLIAAFILEKGLRV